MQLLKKVFHHFHSDSLYRNSIYLMLSTFVMSVLGFFFWIVCARFYSTEQIGLATTLLSVNSFIMTFSMLGFNNALIRYLPGTKNKNEFINTVMTLVGGASCFITVIYLLGIHIFTPKLSFIVSTPAYLVVFLLMVMISSLNNISDSVFIAFRSTIYILVYNTALALTKLSLPIFFIQLHAFGIFLSVCLGITTALGMTFVFLMTKFHYRPYFAVNRIVIKETFKFSFINYLASFVSGLPPMLLPIIITNKIGPSHSAYFYMVMMITNLLSIIPMSITRSLFAEGSHNEQDLKKNIYKAMKIIALILIPAVLVTILFGHIILLAFGKEYSQSGIIFLRLMAVTSLFTPINYILSAIFNVKGKTKPILGMCFVGTILILGTSMLFINNGLTGIGIGWLIGEILTASIYLIVAYITFK